MLDALGLAPEEEAVYRFLVERPSSTGEEIRAGAGLDVLDLGRTLSSLEDKGLLAHVGSEHGRYVASPPGVALGALLVQRQEELRRAQSEMTALIGLYRGGGHRHASDVIDVVHGAEAIGQRFAQLQHSARRTVQTLSKPIAAVVTREDNDETERAALARGVEYHAVVERAAFEDPGFAAAAEEAVALGVSLRVAPSLPLRLLVVDRELAIVPVAAENAAAPVVDALLVHPSGLLDGLLAVFDLIWSSAVIVGAGRSGLETRDPDQLDPADRSVLSLLLAGLTDQTIGAQLGLSLRTVQRRVRQLMNRAGVETRLQLGYEAARRGWA